MTVAVRVAEASRAAAISLIQVHTTHTIQRFTDVVGDPLRVAAGAPGLRGPAYMRLSRRRSVRMRPYSAERFQTRLAISVSCTAFRP